MRLIFLLPKEIDIFLSDRRIKPPFTDMGGWVKHESFFNTTG